MKIENALPKAVKFKELGKGDVFFADGETFIVIKQYGEQNCVCLNDGDFGFYLDDDMVIPLPGSFTYKEE